MDKNYHDQFRLAIMSVFECVSDCGISAAAPMSDVRLKNYSSQLTSVIGLTGRRKGCMVLGMTRESALNLSAAMIKEMPRQVDASVFDALSSFANMSAGMVIYNLRELQLTAAMPTIIYGENTTWFPSGVNPTCIPFETGLGPFTLTYGWIE